MTPLSETGPLIVQVQILALPLQSTDLNVSLRASATHLKHRCDNGEKMRNRLT